MPFAFTRFFAQFIAKETTGCGTQATGYPGIHARLLIVTGRSVIVWGIPLIIRGLLLRGHLVKRLLIWHAPRWTSTKAAQTPPQQTNPHHPPPPYQADN